MREPYPRPLFPPERHVLESDFPELQMKRLRSTIEFRPTLANCCSVSKAGLPSSLGMASPIVLGNIQSEERHVAG